MNPTALLSTVPLEVLQVICLSLPVGTIVCPTSTSQTNCQTVHIPSVWQCLDFSNLQYTVSLVQIARWITPTLGCLTAKGRGHTATGVTGKWMHDVM
ncbi:hypothetical protein M427DRAFT_135543 [Gonapodya prolifera JEL478]|uniref:F-box domain-containing protein n=1 Tax=Gonapodya prolifera (strain JEL478) TaxID=1344416 RepID=A0A139ADL7_GONPJ|nr:hypothetical protein M427DRAFT_135543 [Gonapodya prolifera JEL478]|eukprot:KXS14867.1 hypothetical protein M427DRAFT_135543 [Gonapodya prolifera JEL478]